MGKSRYMNREQFENVAAEGDAMGFNRQIAPWVPRQLPADAKFKVSPLLIHEHIGGERSEPHMRTTVEFRFASGKVGSAFVDMKMETFSRLPTAIRKPTATATTI